MTNKKVSTAFANVETDEPITNIIRSMYYKKITAVIYGFL
jgi:hypothetical protein